MWIEYKQALIGLLVISPIVWFFVLHEYQKMRLLVLFNPNVDPYGSGYHVIQSKISIGSGGFIGQGLFSGTQSQLDFLPENHTDFIFSVIRQSFSLRHFFYVVIPSVYQCRNDTWNHACYRDSSSLYELWWKCIAYEFILCRNINERLPSSQENDV